VTSLATRCIVCGAVGPYAPVFERGGFTMVRCPACGLVFQDPQPGDAALEATYYHDEEWTEAIEGELRPVMLERGREHVARLEAAGVRPPGRLLDVGASGGAFMEVAAAAGWEVTGVELGAATAQAARARGLDVRTGTLGEQAGALGGPFDLVTFWDVLEHLRDPRVELELARSLLASEGRLAATMPNVEGWYPRVTHRLFARTVGRWEYPELPVHLYDFGPRTLRLLLENAGFVDVHHRTYETPFWYYRRTSLSPGALGASRRARALRLAFEAVRVPVYPLARMADRSNSQFVVARPA
jgi:SAM-dependent methyltransferase